MDNKGSPKNKTDNKLKEINPQRDRDSLDKNNNISHDRKYRNSFSDKRRHSSNNYSNNQKSQRNNRIPEKPQSSNNMNSNNNSSNNNQMNNYNMTPPHRRQSYSRSRSFSHSHSPSGSYKFHNRRSSPYSRNNMEQGNYRDPHRRNYNRYMHNSNNNNSHNNNNSSNNNRMNKSPRERYKRKTSSENSAENSGNVLYISNLPKRISLGELREKFEKFGKVEDVSIVKEPFTKENRGFCFITYESGKSAKEAMENLNRTEIDGKHINIELSKRSKPHKPTPGVYLGPKTENYHKRNDYRRDMYYRRPVSRSYRSRSRSNSRRRSRSRSRSFSGGYRNSGRRSRSYSSRRQRYPFYRRK